MRWWPVGADGWSVDIGAVSDGREVGAPLLRAVHVFLASTVPRRCGGGMAGSAAALACCGGERGGGGGLIPWFSADAHPGGWYSAVVSVLCREHAMRDFFFQQPHLTLLSILFAATADAAFSCVFLIRRCKALCVRFLVLLLPDAAAVSLLLACVRCAGGQGFDMSCHAMSCHGRRTVRCDG